MTETDRLRPLRLALRVIAVLFVFGVYPMTVFWPAGWAWHDAGSSPYLQMIIALYATLGVLLWIAARDPQRHLALVSFTLWSSVAHGGTMAVQALADPHHVGHLYGDVPALFLVAAVLAWLSPRALMLRFGGEAE